MPIETSTSIPVTQICVNPNIVCLDVLPAGKVFSEAPPAKIYKYVATEFVVGCLQGSLVPSAPVQPSPVPSETGSTDVVV